MLRDQFQEPPLCWDTLPYSGQPLKKCLCSSLCLFTLVWAWRLPSCAAESVIVQHAGSIFRVPPQKQARCCTALFWSLWSHLAAKLERPLAFSQGLWGLRVYNWQTDWPSIAQHLLKEGFPKRKGYKGFVQGKWASQRLKIMKYACERYAWFKVYWATFRQETQAGFYLDLCFT